MMRCEAMQYNIILYNTVFLKYEISFTKELDV